MGFYYGETILRARAQYRCTADGQVPSNPGDWQQAELSSAELAEHSAAEPLTLSAVEREPDRLRKVLRTALERRAGKAIELRQMAVEVECTDTIDHPPTSYAHWLPVPEASCV